MLLLAWQLVTPAESAAQAATYSLDYNAPEGCPDAQVLGAEIAMRAGRQVVGIGSPLVVRIFPDGSGATPEYVGTFELGGSTSGARAGSCRELVQQLAAGIAGALQGQSSGGLAAPAPQTPPPAPAPAAQASGRQFTLRVTSDDERGLRLHQVTGRAHGWVSGWGTYGGRISSTAFAPICEAPCEVQVGAGQYQLGVSLGEREPAVVSDLLRLDSDMTLRLDYESRRGLRVAGWVIFGAGVVAGLGIVAAPLFTGDDLADLPTESIYISLGVGVGVIVVATVVSLVMILQKDRATAERVADVLREGVRF